MKIIVLILFALAAVLFLVAAILSNRTRRDVDPVDLAYGAAALVALALFLLTLSKHVSL